MQGIMRPEVFQIVQKLCNIMQSNWMIWNYEIFCPKSLFTERSKFFWSSGSPKAKEEEEEEEEEEEGEEEEENKKSLFPGVGQKFSPYNVI